MTDYATNLISLLRNQINLNAQVINFYKEAGICTENDMEDVNILRKQNAQLLKVIAGLETGLVQIHTHFPTTNSSSNHWYSTGDLEEARRSFVAANTEEKQSARKLLQIQEYEEMIEQSLVDLDS